MIRRKEEVKIRKVSNAQETAISISMTGCCRRKLLDTDACSANLWFRQEVRSHRISITVSLRLSMSWKERQR